MLGLEWPAKKREREDDEQYGSSGFSEHRLKRRISNLPHRAPTNVLRQPSPSFGFESSSLDPAPPTITPVDSDTEGPATPAEAKSFYSPWSTPVKSSQMDTIASSQNSTLMVDAPASSPPGDMDMMDTALLSPGPFQNDPATTISTRIPTPIHSNFSPFPRPDKILHTGYGNHEADFADDEGIVDRFRRNRRLPSPISEGEMSPSILAEGISEMQMEVERSSPTLKKGHTRSKHSLRPWTGPLGENGEGGMKRSFTMGYRSDCEKCKMRVPGHFSHIITG